VTQSLARFSDAEHIGVITMNTDPVNLMTPRILVVDDERQIHASLRLRLGREYDLVFCFDAQDALEKLSRDRFDLCFADIHMPRMDGIAFINAARKVDPELGYVVLSAFDTDDNLRRTIPLQVYDFVSKPLPERDRFEGRIRDWVDETRQRRREHALAEHAETIASDRDSARLEREVEIVASESARDALLQSATMLTTVHAHLVSALALLTPRVRSDPGAMHLFRNLEEGRRAADAAMATTAGFFDSAYGSRDSSPALVNPGMREAISISMRISQADRSNKVVDFCPLERQLSIRGLSGIDFLLMMVPAVGAALLLTGANRTVRIHGEYCSRLDTVIKDPRMRSHLWINRRNTLGSHAGIFITIAASAPALTRAEIEAWLKGKLAPLATLTPSGLVARVQKCQGLLGFSLSPEVDLFRVVLVLPT
jgi:CheY-like chemotaxis protein